MSENSDKLSINTITQQNREWRCMVLVELYFNTLGKLNNSTEKVGCHIVRLMHSVYMMQSLRTL
jgi:hypothetical protein